MLCRRVRELGLSPTLAVGEMARRLRAEGRDVVDLSVGQPAFDSPEAVKAAGRRAIDENRTRYTPTAGIEELRLALCERLRAKRGVEYAPDQLLVSPGAKASLYLLFMALLDDGDEVLVPAPYWTSYPVQVRLAGGQPVLVPCAEERGFKLTPDEIERALTRRTKALILNYPANPTGATYSAAELEPLAALCLRHGVWIVADEIYSELLYEGRTFTSVAGLSREVAARSVVIDGMSKTYAMTGWRIGYAAGPAEVIGAMTRLQSHSMSNATSISQWASLAALALSPRDLAPRLAELTRRRQALLDGLEAIPSVSCVPPAGAFYAFVNVSRLFGPRMGSAAELARYLIEQAGVAAVPGEAFGSPAHLRLSFAVSEETLRTGLQRIADALAGLRVA
jgi:aspartate aminotransferase